MKAICAFCGHGNRAGAEICARCGGSLANARRERFRIPLASWLPLFPVAALLWFQLQRGERALGQGRVEGNTARDRLAAEHQAASQKLRSDHERHESALEAQYRAMLQDARLISGAEAAERHANEWQRRQNHNPAIAASLLEKTLLEIERVGKDQALTAEAALRKVAELVMPPRSRIEVTPGKAGFVVRVAFRLAAVSPEEAGGATQHTSSAEIRKEIEEMTGRVIKELFDACGARGIQRLSVSCNRALVIGEGDAERLAMRSVYRAAVDASTAEGVANWRNASIGQIASLMRVEHDVISGLIIRHDGSPGLAEDPNEPLEF